jgi:hypothetical protein
VALANGQAVIIQALRKLGQVRAGYTPPPELLADGLNEWITLFDEWATDRTMGFSIPTYVYPVLGPGSQSSGNGYLLGPTATTALATPTTNAGGANDWNGPRPPIIVRANLKFTSGTGQPVYIHLRPISAEEWAGLSIRVITAINVTNVFYWDPQFPNGVFNVFPPLSGNAIELFCSQALAAPATLATAYSAPPGYLDAVIKSLAERLWSMIPSSVCPNKRSPEWLAGSAYEACQKIQMLNRPIPMLASDFPRAGGGPGGFYDSNVTNTGLPI